MLPAARYIIHNPANHLGNGIICDHSLWTIVSPLPNAARSQAARRSQNLLRLLLPGSAAERGALAVTSAVRLLVSPAASLALVGYLARAGLLPADPVCALVLLVQVGGN